MIRAAAFRVSLAVAAVWASAPAHGQVDEIDPSAAATGYPYAAYPDRSSISNQSSVALPAPVTPYGQDEVRSAAGVSCRSSVASSGPYFDVGMIGSNDVYERSGAAVYGRVVIPLGRRPRRVDCTNLYNIEIERLRMELEVMRLGLSVGGVMDTAEQAPETAATAGGAPMRSGPPPFAPTARSSETVLPAAPAAAPASPGVSAAPVWAFGERAPGARSPASAGQGGPEDGAAFPPVAALGLRGTLDR